MSRGGPALSEWEAMEVRGATLQPKGHSLSNGVLGTSIASLATRFGVHRRTIMRYRSRVIVCHHCGAEFATSQPALEHLVGH